MMHAQGLGFMLQRLPSQGVTIAEAWNHVCVLTAEKLCSRLLLYHRFRTFS